MPAYIRLLAYLAARRTTRERGAARGRGRPALETHSAVGVRSAAVAEHTHRQALPRAVARPEHAVRCARLRAAAAVGAGAHALLARAADGGPVGGSRVGGAPAIARRKPGAIGQALLGTRAATGPEAGVRLPRDAHPLARGPVVATTDRQR